MPAPKSLVSERSAAQLAALNSSVEATQNAVLMSLPKALETAASTTRNESRIAQLSLTPTDWAMKVGDKRRFAIELKSDLSLSLALLALRFNPNVVKVRRVFSGTLFPTEKGPTVTQSVDPGGICLISISALPGAPIKGSESLSSSKWKRLLRAMPNSHSTKRRYTWRLRTHVK